VWFETTMLGLVLIVALCGSLAGGPPQQHGAQNSDRPATEQPQRLASGS
jgi:hypothetical protein